MKKLTAGGIAGTALFWGMLAFAHEDATPHVHAPDGTVKTMVRATTTKPLPIRPYVNAIKASTTEARKDFRSDVKDIRTDAKERAKLASSTEERKAIREEAKNQIAERKISQRLISMVKVSKAALERLDILMDRFSTHLDKATEKGVDVSKAKSLLAVAETKATEAKTAVADLEAKIPELSKGENEAMKEAVKKVQNAVKGAYEAFREAMHALPPRAKTATTTPTTSSNTGTSTTAQ